MSANYGNGAGPYRGGFESDDADSLRLRAAAVHASGWGLRLEHSEVDYGGTGQVGGKSSATRNGNQSVQELMVSFPLFASSDASAKRRATRSTEFRCFGGLRRIDDAHSLESFQPSSGTSISSEGDEWYDAVIGLRATWKIASTFSFSVHGDYGPSIGQSGESWRGSVGVKVDASASASIGLRYDVLEVANDRLWGSDQSPRTDGLMLDFEYRF